jgi:hypothetical protein
MYSGNEIFPETREGKRKMTGSPFDQARSLAANLTGKEILDSLPDLIDGEMSRLCPAVPRKAFWYASRYSFERHTGPIAQNSGLDYVGALCILEFQPDIQA